MDGFFLSVFFLLFAFFPKSANYEEYPSSLWEKTPRRKEEKQKGNGKGNAVRPPNSCTKVKAGKANAKKRKKNSFA